MKAKDPTGVLKRAASMDDKALISFLSDPASPNADLLLPCPAKKCRAPEGALCVGVVGLTPSAVHFARRMKRLMLTAGRPR